jgi:hypothetical protein
MKIDTSWLGFYRNRGVMDLRMHSPRLLILKKPNFSSFSATTSKIFSYHFEIMEVA